MIKYGTITPKEGHPMRVSNWLKRRLVREATKRPTINLMELGRSMAQMRESLHRTAVSLGREKKVIIWGGTLPKPCLRHVPRRQNLNSLALEECTTFGRTPIPNTSRTVKHGDDSIMSWG